VAAIALGRALTALLFNVGPSDPVAILLAVGLLLVVAAVASWIPARRAARVDPVKAMHQP
jgi:ABC-type antimicrobial peptide transport system permease subunit